MEYIEKNNEYIKVICHSYLPFGKGSLHNQPGGIMPSLRNSLFTWFQIPFYFFAQLYHLLKIIRIEKIDIISSQFMLIQGVTGAIVRKFLGIPHILTIHSQGLFTLKKVPFGRYIARFIIRNTDMIITISTFIKSTLDELTGYDSKAEILPLGVNMNTFFPKKNTGLKAKYNIQEKYVLLFIGRLLEVKGIEYLIASMKLIISKIANIKLLIIGDGALKPELENKTQELNLTGHISFLGAKKHEELVDYYNICDLLVLPSILDKYGQTEGRGVVIFEAMACGKPVIASNIGGIPETVRNGYTGFLTAPGNAEDIAAKIIMALTQCNLEKMGKIAREDVLKYDWEEIGRKYRQIIGNITGNHGHIKKS